MSELSKSKLKEIVDILLDEYNTTHNTSYKWIKSKSYIADSLIKPGVDAIAYESEKELEIQHKQVIWDVETDQIRNKLAKKVVDELIKYLKNQDLVQYSIHLNFDVNRIPATDDEIRELGFWIAHLINSKTFDSYPKPPLLFLIPNTLTGKALRLRSRMKVIMVGIRDTIRRARDSDNINQHVYSYEDSDETYLKVIRKFSSSIAIFKNPDRAHPVVGYGFSKKGLRPLPHYGDVIIGELKKNLLKYTNELILLDCQKPVDTIDHEIIRKELKSIKYGGEIWIIENFVNNRKAIRIYPIDNDKLDKRKKFSPFRHIYHTILRLIRLLLKISSMKIVFSV